MMTEAQERARQALIDSMAAVSIASPEQMADMVLTELESRGYAIKWSALIAASAASKETS